MVVTPATTAAVHVVTTVQTEQQSSSEDLYTSDFGKHDQSAPPPYPTATQAPNSSQPGQACNNHSQGYHYYPLTYI